MKFNIIILDQFYDMFIDLAYQLQHYFNLNNIKNEIVNYTEDIENTENLKYIFFGTAFRSYRIPNNSILTMFDNIKLFDTTFPRHLLENNIILHYNPTEMIQLKNKYPFLKIFYFKMGYAKALDFSNLKIEENISFKYDVCFVGNLSERRKNILNKLSQHGLNVFAGGYHPFYSGISRARLYHSSKIVLSFYTNEDTFDCSLGSRFIPAISNNCFVICESSTNKIFNDFMENISIVCNYDSIVENCIYYLHNEIERINKLETFYNNMKNCVADIELNKYL
jgi:hypothetical protein